MTKDALERSHQPRAIQACEIGGAARSDDQVLYAKQQRRVVLQTAELHCVAIESRTTTHSQPISQDPTNNSEPSAKCSLNGIRLLHDLLQRPVSVWCRAGNTSVHHTTMSTPELHDFGWRRFDA